MALVFADRVKETSTTTGTGSYTLAGAEAGHQSISDAVGAGNQAYFCAEDGTDWEVFLGTYNEGSLSRGTILASSNSGSAVDWGAGTKNVFLVVPASVISEFSPKKITEVIKSSTGNLSVAECSGTLISNYGQSAANTQTLPTAQAGLSGTCIIATAGAGAFHLKAGANDKIYLDGTALDDGDKASISTPAIGNSMSFIAFQTGSGTFDWLVISGPGATVTDGGA